MKKRFSFIVCLVLVVAMLTSMVVAFAADEKLDVNKVAEGIYNAYVEKRGEEAAKTTNLEFDLLGTLSKYFTKDMLKAAKELSLKEQIKLAVMVNCGDLTLGDGASAELKALCDDLTEKIGDDTIKAPVKLNLFFSNGKSSYKMKYNVKTGKASGGSKVNYASMHPAYATPAPTATPAPIVPQESAMPTEVAPMPTGSAMPPDF